MHMRVLVILTKRQLNMITLHLYQQLNCINKITIYLFARLIGFMLGFGLVLFVVGNLICITEFNIFPVFMYKNLVEITAIAYTILFEALTMPVQVNEESNRIINSWKENICFKSKRRRFWIMKIQAQQPVSIYYAKTKCDHDTQVGYYFNIVDHTVNALLLFN